MWRDRWGVRVLLEAEVRSRYLERVRSMSKAGGLSLYIVKEGVLITPLLNAQPVQLAVACRRLCKILVEALVQPL